jgi:hypothetical protein
MVRVKMATGYVHVGNVISIAGVVIGLHLALLLL